MSYTGVIASTTDTPPPQQDEHAVSSAVQASGGTTPRLRFLDSSDAGSERAAVMVWPQGTPLLAELVALFADLGLQVASHEQLPPADSGTPVVHRFGFRTDDSDWDTATPGLVSAAFEAAAAGHLEVDGFTRLISAATVTWSDAVLMRAACRYLRQVGLGLSEPNIVAILLRHREFSRGFRALFAARFDPARPDRDTAVAAAEKILLSAIEKTATLDEDRLLRGLWSFTWAVLRTNWFRHDRMSGNGTASVAFKIDPSLLSLSASVTPYREIFVHSRIVEGSHVRSGPVSRGGLRWSDRKDDFRTEVLGLMKTQHVKNSLIVPMGAKGAFVVRTDPTPDAVREAYTNFIEGLLDVTDDIVDGAVVHPRDTVIYDGDDAYLVVAADKGTARFSDLANSIATRRGFWLGDAFASGGSAGYDHKAMGITARGGWVSVRRHFAEMGKNVDTDAFTVVGIGDMSGDVFGNGMLLSRAIRLVGAFDHRHIFLDPDPDSEASYRERERLAAVPGSSWDDYDRNLVSAGGGVWPRTAKKIPLSPQVRERLGVTETDLPPHEVVKALLTAEVDLLWNGGIGTYVKASAEGQADAADPANDSVRVDADMLRTAVVGEGGNLGFTQRARIEYALKGGRINADFIDNATGVATSDREVNLKIAVDAAVAAGELPAGERNTLLARVQNEIAESVLADAAAQTLAISLAEVHAPFLLGRHERLIENLERDAGLSRSAEVLPTSAELTARHRAGQGLVRPEIAVLLAQSKNLVVTELLASPVLDDAVFEGVLADYFPAPIRKRVPQQISGHRLAREIVAVIVAGDMIDRVGPGLIHRLEERVGVGTADITSAYAVVRQVFDIDRLWHEVLALRGASHRTRLTLHVGIQDLIEHTTSWLLRHRTAGSDARALIERFAGPVRELATALPRLTGAPAQDLSTLRILAQGFALEDTARTLGSPITQVAETYREFGRVVGLDWLSERFSVGETGTAFWETMAAAVLVDNLQEHWHALIGSVLRDASPDTSAADAVAAWLDRHTTAAERLSQMLGELRSRDRVDNSSICVIVAELTLALNRCR
ncbi:NAD-glutamate dehydrogenase domain-containing protein [Rhodococcus tibetensis]|uniref:NAD-glutamate dehydrogenase n=1 Tax=Rhodococcus tibetensis TaxID=2965064 RepID=A0ABT1Q7I0_9NOCA|nr:NAD-glutamate dehydrogenase domain-containing protein [Rhodococcus sp. FXJ9.536]MCQ4118209.1 NAD-glutamate dehydrogenase [Rhodococcus sp. FXJ9.536]